MKRILVIQLMLFVCIVTYSFFISLIPYERKNILYKSTEMIIFHDSFLSLIEIKKEGNPIYLVKSLNLRISKNKYIYIPYDRKSIDSEGFERDGVIYKGDNLINGVQGYWFAISYDENRANVLVNDALYIFYKKQV